MPLGTFKLTKEFFRKKEAPARILTVDFVKDMKACSI